MFGIDLHEYFHQPWEQARGMLAEELDQLKAELRGRWNASLGTDNQLTTAAISGDGTPASRYLANTGPRNKPQWDLVNLLNGVKNRLRFNHLVQIGAGTLLGRRSSSAGDIEEITVGSGLQLSGTTLSATSTEQHYMPVFIGGLAVTSGDALIAIQWEAPTV